MTAVTEDRQVRQEQEPEPEQLIDTEWTPVSAWGAEAQEIIEDIENIRRVQGLLRTGASLASHPEFSPAMDALETALNGRRVELAQIVLKLHRGELVERMKP